MNLNFTKLKNAFSGLFKEASSSQQITNANLKNFLIKQVGFDSKSDDFAPAENDLAEAKAAIETDSYIKVALDKMFQLIFKAGFKLTSNNEAATEYLQQRIRLMEFGTGIPFNIMLQEIARDMVYYSNSFWIKSRTDKIQGGLQVKPVLAKKPVGGYFRADPTIMQIKRDSSGAVRQYKISGAEEKTFNAEDVVHFYADRDASNSFGTPRIISVLEDVKILRKIEGNALSLIYRFSIPLYQMKIGLPEQNFMATDQEIKDAQKQIQQMSMDGMLVTNERTQFYVIGADGQAIDISPYLSYYEKRVFTGLNVSEAMMGRGGSKQDADSMEGIMHDTVKYFQNIISIFIENSIFNELLLEGGFNPIMNIDDIVKFEFNEINLDTKVKMENHELVKYQSNAITFEELRRSIGRKAEGVDEGRLYSNMITTANAIQLINAKAAAESGGASGNIKNGKTRIDTPSGEAKSIGTPSNGSGSSFAKIKEEFAPRTLLPIKEYSTEDRIERFKDKYDVVYKIYISLGNDIKKKKYFPKELQREYIKKIGAIFTSIIENESLNGYKDSIITKNKKDNAIQYIKDNYVSDKISDATDNTIKRFIEDLASKINKIKEPDKDKIDIVISFMEYRLRFASEYLSKKSYNYAMMLNYKNQGIETIELDLSDNDKKKHKSVVKTNKFELEQIPPFSPYCSCKIVKPKIVKK